MKPKFGLLFLLSIVFVLTAHAAIIPGRLTCEYLINPMVIDARVSPVVVD